MDNDIITIKCTENQKTKIVNALLESRECIFTHSCDGRCQKCLNDCIKFDLTISCVDCFNFDICKLASDNPLDECRFFKAITDKSESK